MEGQQAARAVSLQEQAPVLSAVKGAKGASDPLRRRAAGREAAGGETANRAAQGGCNPLILLAETMEQVEAEVNELQDVDAALRAMGQVQETTSNPFLHLSMHLSITEQCSIDQPRGIRQAVELLTARRGDLHDAHHEVMEELGIMMWESQRASRPPDGQAYIDRVQQRATRDG